MKKQDYANHVRYYPPHHFVFYPLILLLIIGSGWMAANNANRRWEWLAIMVLFIMVAWLSFMVRQHYALTVQNRIVRLEMRLRYYQLTQTRFESVEGKLHFSQLAALRFASDDELPALVDRAIHENLQAADIKKAVKSWVPDTMRV